MTKKPLLIAALLLATPLAASAAPNVGGCGWGSKLMAGNEGIAPQVLAVTTNGTSGNQTFGITSGTSGCSQDGVVSSNWKTAMYIDSNKNMIARDMSVGSGESLETLASTMGIEDPAHRDLFFATAQQNFVRIFPTPAVSSADVVSSLKAVMAEQEALSSYAQAI